MTPSAVNPPPGTETGWPDQPEEANLADVVALAVTSVPGVTGLHPGAFREVATYLPGRRVTGIRLTDELVEVHVRLLMGTELLPTAEAIRAVVEPIVHTDVHVYVEDVDATMTPEPVAEPVVEPVAEPVAGSGVGPGAEPTIEPVIEPVIGPDITGTRPAIDEDTDRV